MNYPLIAFWRVSGSAPLPLVPFDTSYHVQYVPSMVAYPAGGWGDQALSDSYNNIAPIGYVTAPANMIGVGASKHVSEDVGNYPSVFVVGASNKTFAAAPFIRVDMDCNASVNFTSGGPVADKTFSLCMMEFSLSGKIVKTFLNIIGEAAGASVKAYIVHHANFGIDAPVESPRFAFTGSIEHFFRIYIEKIDAISYSVTLDRDGVGLGPTASLVVNDSMPNFTGLTNRVIPVDTGVNNINLDLYSYACVGYYV